MSKTHWGDEFGTRSTWHLDCRKSRELKSHAQNATQSVNIANDHDDDDDADNPGDVLPFGANQKDDVDLHEMQPHMIRSYKEAIGDDRRCCCGHRI